MRTRLKKLLLIVGELRARRRARVRALERRVLAIGKVRRAFRTPGGAAVKIGVALIFAFGGGISLGIGIAAIADRSLDGEENVVANVVPDAKPLFEAKPVSEPKRKEEPVYSVPVRVRRLPAVTPPQGTPADVATAMSGAIDTPAVSAPAEPSVAQPPAGSLVAETMGPQQARRDTPETPETERADSAPPSVAPEMRGVPDEDGPAATSHHAHHTPHVSVPLPPPPRTGNAPQQNALLPEVTVSPDAARERAGPSAVQVDPLDPLQVPRSDAEIDHTAVASIAAGPDRVDPTELLKAVDEAPVGVEHDQEAVESSEFVIASLPPASEALWIRNAAETPPLTGDAMIAIIIDDMGIDQKRSRRAIEMASPLTLSFIPYGYHLRELTTKARAAGHEVMLHLPMEPMDPEANPGPNALLTKLTPDELLRRLRWGLKRFDGYVGINNHMGSKFTAWRPGMRLVMNEIRSRGLMFLDSWTNNRSVGLSLSKEFKVPNAARDIFIDHNVSRVAIKHSLAELEYIARRRGFAVGIGHPHDLTLELLRRWVRDARSRGIDFVPISAIVRRGMKSG